MLNIGKKVFNNKKGQGTVEYIVVVAGLMGEFLSVYILYSHLVPQQVERGAKMILMDYYAD